MAKIYPQGGDNEQYVIPVQYKTLIIYLLSHLVLPMTNTDEMQRAARGFVHLK